MHLLIKSDVSGLIIRRSSLKTLSFILKSSSSNQNQFCHKCNILYFLTDHISISCMTCYFALYFSLAGQKETNKNNPLHTVMHIGF